MKFSFFLFGLLTLSSTFAKDNFLDSVERKEWGGLDVVWVKDDRFPKFTASIYFKDGAFSDTIPGLTQTTLDLFTAGTTKETQRQLSEFFDFYGAKVRNSVTHEYSVMSVQGLTRDIRPIMTKVCEIFRDANYPQDELGSYVQRSKSGLRNLVTSHASLADRIFRQVSLQGTPYEAPVEGTLVSYDKFTPANLRERLDHLKKTKKVLYLAGPEEVLGMKDVISECQWKDESSVREVKLAKPSVQTRIFLVPVPGANQAQIRIGRYMTEEEVTGKHENYQFLSSFLGGSFTSKLVQELRVKRGLTYSAGAYVSMQKDYGRAGIMTFSKNETTAEAISIIRDVFQEVATGKVTEGEFKHQQGHQIGAYAFGFEETSAFIGQLMLYDHQGRKYEELAKFPEIIGGLTPKDLASAQGTAFPWERLTIVVVGDKSLERSLSRIRPVTVLKFEDFL